MIKDISLLLNIFNYVDNQAHSWYFIFSKILLVFYFSRPRIPSVSCGRKTEQKTKLKTKLDITLPINISKV